MTNIKKVVAVSGGFDPIHIGHVRLIKEAKKLGNKLVVILNNDNWLKAKKGYVFMPEEERKEILEALKYIDKVVISNHSKNPEDMSIAKEIKEIKPDIFANGGDRREDNKSDETKEEEEVCKLIGCEIVYNVGHGGKIQSSSELVEKASGKNEKYN